MALACYIYVFVGSKYPPAQKIPDNLKTNFLLLLPFTIRLVQRTIYYILSIRALKTYQRSIVHIFSDTSRINLNWMKWLINGFLFLIFTSIAFYFAALQYPAYFDLWVLISGVIVAVYIFMSVFKGMTQSSLWQIHPNITKETLEEELHTAGQIVVVKNETEKNASQKSGLANSKINEISGKILGVMENEKLYQEPELTLQHLADKLQFPSYQVSQAINEGLKKSFYDLVNGYRVEEAKRLLLDPTNKNYTILSVGFEAGFNSKTTFNTVFKKFTGYTPSEFRSVKEIRSLKSEV
jgi:AraC-like DNA-binding protein